MLPSGMLDTHATVGKTLFLSHGALVVTPAMFDFFSILFFSITSVFNSCVKIYSVILPHSNFYYIKGS